jgi:DUF2924 family protein
MTESDRQQVALLPQMTAAQLYNKYQEVFGEVPRSRHKLYLVRRIAWRLQALAEGDLSERAHRRAAELACDADLRISAPPACSRQEPLEQATAAKGSRRRHLPAVGTVLARPYRGRTIELTVLAQGFQYDGQFYRSLSAVAKAVTGKHWNGYHFFGLWKPSAKAGHA